MTLKKISMIAAAAASMALLPSTQANAQAASTQFLGQLMLNGSNFCPRDWANADGQLLPIAQNTALFSLFGTMYGGDGRTTFALPDLRSRVPIHTGMLVVSALMVLASGASLLVGERRRTRAGR